LESATSKTDPETINPALATTLLPSLKGCVNELYGLILFTKFKVVLQPAEGAVQPVVFSGDLNDCNLLLYLITNCFFESFRKGKLPGFLHGCWPGCDC